MKRKIIITVCLICFVMTGCGQSNISPTDNSNVVSIDDYNKVVDERDYYKEQYEKLKNQQTEELPPQDSAPEAASIEEKDEIAFNYYIDDLSSEGIINECAALLNNPPEKGQTIESYEASMKYKPISNNIGEYMMEFYFAKDYDYYKDVTPGKNAMLYIWGRNMGTQMDGTLAIRSDQPASIEIALYIDDYDTAAAVYDGLYELLSPEYTEVKDRREGTNWRASAWYYFTSSSATGVDEFVSLKKQDTNGYILRATKYYPMQ